MKIRPFFRSLLCLCALCTTTAVTSAEEVELLKETFSGGKPSTTSWGSTSTNLLSDGNVVSTFTDVDGWTGVNLRPARGGSVLFGTTTKKGTLKSPAIELKDSSRSTLRISFSAAASFATTAKNLGFHVTLTDNNGMEIEATDFTPLPQLASEDIASVIEGCGQPYIWETTKQVTSPFYITFDPAQTDSRIFLDDVSIYQLEQIILTQLATPIVTADGATTDGFTLTWGAIENAASYTVTILDGEGKEVRSTTVTDTTYTATGLNSDTAYTYSVVAKGDGSTYSDSEAVSGTISTTVDAAELYVTTNPETLPDFVFDGTSNSFTITATRGETPVNLSFAGISPAAEELSVPSFENGVFSWNPTLTQTPGEYTLTFTTDEEPSETLTYTITVLKPVEVKTIFSEGFNVGLSQNWTNNERLPVADISKLAENAWTISETYTIPGPQAIRLGLASSGSNGYIISPSIELEAGLQEAEVTISYKAGRTDGTKSVKVQLIILTENGEVYQELSTQTLASLNGNSMDGAGEYTEKVTVPNNFKLKFVSVNEDARIGLDDILVTQEVSKAMKTLPAPAELSATATDCNNISLSWTAVDGAVGYEAEAYLATDTAKENPVTGVVTECTASFTNLSDNTEYVVQVRTLGNNTSTLTSEWAEITVTTPVDEFRPTFTITGENTATVGLEKTLSVVAMVGETNCEVTFTGMEPQSATQPSFLNGTWTWIPDAEGVYALTFSSKGTSETKTYTETFVLNVSVPTITAVTPTLTFADSNTLTFQWEDQFYVENYGIRVWSGSAEYTHEEKRILFNREKQDNLIPNNWTLCSDPEDWYKDSDAPIKMEKTGDIVISEIYPAPVRVLEFTLKENSVDGSPVFTVYASTGEENAVWEIMEVYTGKDNIKGTKKFDSNHQRFVPGKYRRFKFEYTTKEKGNIGLGRIMATYDGAGAKLVAGTVEAPEVLTAETVEYTLTHLYPNTDYWMEFTVNSKSGNANDSKTTRSLHYTTSADPTTLITIR